MTGLTTYAIPFCYDFVKKSLGNKTPEYTASDLFSGHGYSGNDGFSGTKPPDNAFLFTVCGITVLVELFWKILALFVNFITFFMQKVKLKVKSLE